MGSLTTYIQNPTLAALGVTQKLLAPMAAAGDSLSDPRAVLKAGASAVAKGLITSTEFSQLGDLSAPSWIHQKAIGLIVGIVPPMAGRQYNLGGMGFTGTVNLVDNTELSRWLAKNMAKSIAMDAMAAGSKQMSDEFRDALSFDSYSKSNKVPGSYLNNPKYGNPAQP